MPSTAFLTDSSSDLEPLQADTFGLHLLLSVPFDGRDWLDHKELDSGYMFSRIKTGAREPTIRLPALVHFIGVTTCSANMTMCSAFTAVPT